MMSVLNVYVCNVVDMSLCPKEVCEDLKKQVKTLSQIEKEVKKHA